MSTLSPSMSSFLPQVKPASRLAWLPKLNTPLSTRFSPVKSFIRTKCKKYIAFSAKPYSPTLEFELVSAAPPASTSLPSLSSAAKMSRAKSESALAHAVSMHSTILQTLAEETEDDVSEVIDIRHDLRSDLEKLLGHQNSFSRRPLTCTPDDTRPHSPPIPSSPQSATRISAFIDPRSPKLDLAPTFSASSVLATVFDVSSGAGVTASLSIGGTSISKSVFEPSESDLKDFLDLEFGSSDLSAVAEENSEDYGIMSESLDEKGMPLLSREKQAFSDPHPEA
ncbi:hypothetical protein BOTBODRAFT_551605 [Botryobasidium botryosum FD-172 SS1]|uniref:Uncharacterized protein n=1 Tax=Botryobasidium botryosum (strain FD-172 SS1) TaxID=930990 RepID=A0A067N2Y6_BOTB1|nr:hypothetical protein BOTBODRAFT_551605 [Botryobasidium botryosum FD-172 SS1]